mmetsp:Transcript_6348/g.18900  ORF Transcript_6348/g.18900 Transcript_6348/m.18900 type:complete len:168 (-) Transcript_6348:1871-2374(-)
MPLVRNDENVETVVQIENSRRGLVQTMLPDRTGRAATQDVHRVLEPNDEWTLVQEQVVAGWGFVQQLLREGIQTDEEENGGDESVGGTTGEATAGKRIILAKISEGLFFKKEKFEHPKPSRFFIKLLFPSERRRRRENFLKGAAATALQTERERKGHPLVVFERVEK